MEATNKPEKHEKHIVVSFTEEELKQLVTLANNLLYSPTPKDLAAIYPDLLLKLDSLQHTLRDNPAAQGMWFINIYEVNRHPGGPEEGGWCYDTYNCIASYGYSCLLMEIPVSLKDRGKIVQKRDYTGMIDDFIGMCGYYEVESPFEDAHDYQAYNDRLDEGRTITASDIDHNGDGVMLVIERAPGAQHDTLSKHYE